MIDKTIGELVKESFQEIRKLVQKRMKEIKEQDDVRLTDFEEALGSKSGITAIDECKLYHYSRISKYSLYNLIKGQIVPSDVGNMNDIFEGLPRDCYALSDANNDIAGKLVKLYCFSEDVDNTLMWAHYADNNKGMCIEYNLALLNDQHDAIKYLLPVVYEEKRCIKRNLKTIVDRFCNNQLGEKDFNWIAPLYLVKGKEWKYENEWRLVYPMFPMAKKNLSIEIPMPCITAVYLGARISKEDKELVTTLLKEANAEKEEWQRIKIFQMKRAEDSSFTLIAEEVKT